MGKKLIAFIFLALFLITFISANDFAYNYLDNPIVTSSGGTGGEANDTEKFGGYTITEYRSWLQEFFDTIYCKLTGCSFTGNVNIDGVLNVTKNITIADFSIYKEGDDIYIG